MKKTFVRFPTTGKTYSYQTAFFLKKDDFVLVETDQIVEEGKVMSASKEAGEIEEGTGRILRKETVEDRQSIFAQKKTARQYLEEANAKVRRHGLGMKILDADLSYDEKKLTFYFSAAGRVDFRSLVSDLAKTYNKLIRLQQVAGRTEAKYFGGFGRCGRELCCQRFLTDLGKVEFCLQECVGDGGSVKLVGCCGRKLCCLTFEGACPKLVKDSK